MLKGMLKKSLDTISAGKITILAHKVIVQKKNNLIMEERHRSHMIRVIFVL